MEPPKDQSTQTEGASNMGEQPSSANSAGGIPPEATTQLSEPTPEPVAAPAPAPSSSPEPIAAPEPLAQSAAPADHTVEQLPAPEAYGTIGDVAPPMPSMPAPVTGGSDGGKKKKLLIAAGVSVITLLLAGGAVFGLYVPNTPTNVWSTGLNRSGKALDSLVQTATTPDRLKSYTTSELKGTLDAKVGDAKYSGTFNTTFDKTHLNAALNVALQSEGTNETIGAKVVSQVAAGNLYPDVYFQLTGLSTLGLDAFVPGVSTYDGKWIKVDSSYLKSIGDSYLATNDNTKTQVTTQNIADMARAASSVTKDYLFTAAPDKAVLIKKSYVGKEKVDGITAYHYKVGINNQHLQAYCEALSNAVLSTDGYKKISGETTQQVNDEKQAAIKDCKNDASTFKSTNTLDTWIDGHYKLIYKVRVYDPGRTTYYTEVGQLYKGGDKLSLFMNFHDSSVGGDGKLTMDTNIQTSATKLTLTYKQTGGDGPFDVTATLDASGSSKPVQVTIPTGAIPIQDVLKKFGLGDTVPAVNTTGLQGGTRTDTTPLRAS